MMCFNLICSLEAQVKFQFSPCEICGRQSGTGVWFPLSTSVFIRQCHSTNAPSSFSSESYSYGKYYWEKTEDLQADYVVCSL
jgi:hypothetical protein